MGHLTRPRSIIADMTAEVSDQQLMWEVLVPTVGNDGTPFSVRHHRAWDSYVKALSGGMTLIPPVRGDWIDPATSTEYRERMIPVRVVVTREQIVDLCKETARHYDQLAVLAYLIGTQTVMVTNPHATTHNGGHHA